MALWGNQDSKTASGTVSITTGGAVTGSGTSFTSQAKIGNYIRVGSVDYVITTITDNTHCTVLSGVNGGSIASQSGASYTLSEKPVFVARSESHDNGYGSSGDSTKVFGVDAGEAEVTGKAHAGWVRRTAGTGGRSGRVFYETLVAGGSITGDQADDSQFADLAITIGTQPSNVTKTAPATATFTVVATNNGNQAMTYQWQIQQEGAGAWANITGATSASYTTGATATGDGAGATDGDKYRVIITTANGLATVTSNAATLTVV